MLNCAAIMGRLTADPELKKTSQDISVCSFTVAVDRNFVKQGEERQADFIDVTAWRQQAEFVSRFFHKGSMIAVNGSIQTRNWEDKNGNKRKSTEIIADNISFCGGKNENSAGASAAPAFSEPAPSYSTADEGDFQEIPDEDDLPF
ncbi:MAG: single-stranded DNA-binding protein [Clostridia bacterium]|nr:single-stranded DNA-binding protein [Clostridia bacterium]